jgi:hypothetical protein
MLGRKEIADRLKKAVVEHFVVKLNQAVYEELGLVRGGTLRADMYAASLKGVYTLLEVKSGLSDLSTDSKLQHYLRYADRCYLVIPENTWCLARDKVLSKTPRPYGIYILQSTTGYLKCVRPAKNIEDFEDDDRLGVNSRMVLRGDYSPKNIGRSRRRKIYLE